MHLYHLGLNREIEEIYAHFAISSLAKAMIGIFISVYLLSLGFSLAMVFLFYIVYFAAFWVMTYPAAGFAARHGAKHAIAASVPFLIAFYMMLGFLKAYAIPVFAIAAVGGISEAFFWLGLHLDFVRASDRRRRGGEVGLLMAIPLVFTIAGPLAGGVVITLFGFGALFIASSLLLIVSIFPLFLTPDTARKKYARGKSFMTKQNWRQAAGFMGQGAKEMAILFLWPLLVYLIVADIIDVGIVGTLELMFAALATVAIGTLSDRLPRRRILVSSSLTDSVAWVFRFFAAYFGSFLQIVGISMVSGLLGAAQSVSLNAMMYDKGQKRTVDYLVFRQAMLSAGRMIFLAAGIALVIYSADITYLLLLAAAASLLHAVFK